MWTLNSLLRRAPEAWPLALPVAVAIVIHAVVIGASSWRSRAAPPAAAATVVDNTRQLVRLSRRLGGQEPLVPSSLLTLSAKLPPPPELVEAKDAAAKPGAEKPPACPPSALEDKAVAKDKAVDRGKPVAVASGLSVEMIRARWEEGTVAGSWPERFGPLPEGIQLRRLPLTAFPGVNVKQLNRLSLTSDADQFLVRADDQGVWIGRRPFE
ncbi:hypothetical protein SynRS9909_01935 [Synechococcus sp. RS9909]|nr:hypothetical protein SynRS9909_01935 [Synechococcus sp. RS9909]